MIPGYDVKYGEPFLLQVNEGALDGVIKGVEDFGMHRHVNSEPGLITDIRDEVHEFGGGAQIYVCIPIGRIWTDDPGDENNSRCAPNRVVQVEIAEDDLARMAAAALAMGVSNEQERSTNTR